MPNARDKAANEKALAAFKAAFLRLRATKENEEQQERDRLAMQQRFDRDALRIRSRGMGRRAREEAKRLLELLHRRQHRDLEDALRKVAQNTWEQDESVRVWRGRLPSASLPPSAAVAFQDAEALERWNARVGHMMDDEFIEFVRTSHLPTLHRPGGTPEFDEVMEIPATQDRIRTIRTSHNAVLQRALGAALSPVAKGRKPSSKPSVGEVANLRAEVRTLLKAAKVASRGELTYQLGVAAIVDRLLPDVPPAERDELKKDIGRYAVPLSRATAAIVARVLKISKDDALRGPRSKSPRKRRRSMTITADLDRVEHVREARRRGSPKKH
jgi:hypothetical protein